MDRIRKALDLARQERTQNYDSAADSLAGSPAVNADPKTQATPNPPRPISGLPSRIVYTRTHVFTPDGLALNSNRILNPEDNDAAAAAFRMLRTQVIQRMDENAWRTLAVLSPGRDDGKTTTALNLAVSLASDRRHTVLLVDGDLRRPSIAAALGIKPEFGLDDLLRGDARLEQCLYHPEGFDRLVILPARASMANSSEALSGPHGRELVADLRGRYPERIVVFDLPPVLGTDDALAFLPLIECGLVVISERSTRRDDLLRCMELLRKTPLLGTVLNKATEIDFGYG